MTSPGPAETILIPENAGGCLFRSEDVAGFAESSRAHGWTR